MRFQTESATKTLSISVQLSKEGLDFPLAPFVEVKKKLSTHQFNLS